MENEPEDRRKTSQTGLLDCAMRSAMKLAVMPDPTTRALANQIITDLKQIRREIPARRRFDTEPPRKVS